MKLVRGYPYTIRTYQVGSTGEISLHHLFNLFQDVAHRDAYTYGFAHPQMLALNRLWVLSRISVEIDKLPSYDEQVELQTWVKSVGGPKSEREFAMIHNGEKVVRATSLWFCLSAEDHRPARIPMEEKLLSMVFDEHSVTGGAHKLDYKPAGSEPHEAHLIVAKDSDVDMVKHVNNAAYVRWVMDLVRRKYPEQKVSSFSINYLNEVHLGDKLEVKQFAQADIGLYHEVINQSTGKVACKTSTAWQ